MRFAASLALALVSSFALAAPPPNDTCAGAEVVPSTLPYLSPLIADISDATTTGETLTKSCGGSAPSRSVWYVFTPPSTGTYKFSTCADQGTGTTVDDTTMAIFTSGGGCLGPFTEIANGCDDDGCNQEANQSVVSAPLTAGQTYYLVVWKYNATAPTAGHTALQVRVTQPPVPGNDVCGGAQTLALDRVALGTSEGASDDFQIPDSGFACFAGVAQTPANLTGRDVVYGFTAPTTGNYGFQVRTRMGADNPALIIASACPSGTGPQPVNACVAAANHNANTAGATFSASAEHTACVPLTAGAQVWAVVDAVAYASGASHEIEVNECTAEVEPNNTPATSNALACPVTGGIAVNGDVDFYTLGTMQGRAFALVDGVFSSNTDFDLRVTTATSTLEYDDINADVPFGGASAVIAGTPVNGQTYLRVNHFSGTVQSTPYQVYGVIQPGSPGPIAEQEPNDTVATAFGGQRLYFNGELAQNDAGPSPDVDVFSVPAQVGELLFVALDGDPLRNGTPLNAALDLLDPSGAVVMSVDDTGASSNTSTDAGTLTATNPQSPGEAFVFRVRTTGLHAVRVRSGSLTAIAGSGDYLLSITKGCQPVTLGPSPTIATVSPTSGPIAGGTVVTVTGTNFDPAAQVSFGGQAASAVTVAGSTSLTATSPVSTVPGPVSVLVRNPDGQQANRTSGFTYTAAAPTLSALSPSTGSTDGGLTVTLTGTNFYAGATVRFGANTAGAVVVTSATSLTCVSPPGTPGASQVSVTNVDSQTSGTQPFTYVAPPPSVSTVTPTSGPIGGGTVVTLAGGNFQTGASVSFDGIAATNVTVTSVSSLTATTPAHDAGVAVVGVRNPDGQEGFRPSGFTFVPPPPPTVTQVAPVQGTALGGTSVTVTGTNFLTGATVSFGGALATNVVVNSATSISCLTPARPAGQVAVVVTNPGGGQGTRANGYTYVAPPAPTLTGVAPSSGSINGGTAVTLTGTNFAPGATVSFGGTTAMMATVVSPTQITTTTPAHAAGQVDVQVRNADNQTATRQMGFTYVAPPAPTLTEVSPAVGAANFATLVVLKGTNFENGATVTFGGVAATDVVVNSVTNISCRTPPLPAGAVDVAVRNPDNQNVTLAGGYTYEAMTETDAGRDAGAVDGGGGGAGGGSGSDAGGGAGGGLVVPDAGRDSGMADAGVAPPKKGGCGCTSFDGASLSLASLLFLGMRSRRRKS